MKVNDFISNLLLIKDDKHSVSELLNSLIYEFEEDISDTDLENQIRGLKENQFSDFGDKIVTCIAICDELTNNIQSYYSPIHNDKVKQVGSILNRISSFIIRIGEERQVVSKPTDPLSVNNGTLAEQNERIRNLREQVDSATNAIDGKFFYLLLNTVAILGIFVAIAFAGFGTLSIISNIDLTASLTDFNTFIRSTFDVALIALLSYNLLFLLIYFIFKLSRPLSKTNDTENSEADKVNSLNLVPFYVIDGILFVITIGLFIWTTVLS